MGHQAIPPSRGAYSGTGLLRRRSPVPPVLENGSHRLMGGEGVHAIVAVLPVSKGTTLSLPDSMNLLCIQAHKGERDCQILFSS